MSRILPISLALLALAAGTAPALAAGDPDNGTTVFKRCQACHTADARHKIGPSLIGVIGRAAGTAEGYRYSDAMRAFGASGTVWDESSLDAYLADPRGTVRGTRKAFQGLRNHSDRADVIAYLTTLSP